MRTFLRFLCLAVLLSACKSTTTTSSGPKVGLSFDGQDDYVQVADAPAFAFGRGDFTWEVWIKRNWVGVRTEILSKKDLDADSEHDIVLFLDQDDKAYAFLRERLHTTPALYLPSRSRIGTEWTHLAMVRSAGRVTLYVNGVAESSANSTYDVTSTGPFRIGANRQNLTGAEGTPWFNFGGLIQEVRIWKVARTGRQIQDAMRKPAPVPTSGLVAYYPLWGGSDTQVVDRSGSGNHGQARNGAAWVSSDSPLPGRN